MNTFYKTMILAFIISGLASCATGKNAFDKGDYETALNRAVKRLQSNPNNSKARQVLVEGYSYASNFHLDKIRQFEKSNDTFKWERIYSEYALLNKYYRDINRCPACLNAVTPKSYLNEQNQAADEAADVQLTLGLDALSVNTVAKGRQAYSHFEAAFRFNNQIPGIDSLLDVSLDMGTVKVLIEPIPVHSRNLELTNEYFENRMFEYFRRYERDRFVKFLNYDEVNQFQIEPDHIITMKFDDFVLGQSVVKSETQKIERDSVVVGSYTDNEGISHDVFGTVKADFTMSTKTMASAGILNFEIRDAYTNQVLINRKIENEDVWRYEWASYNGDERALTKDEIRLAKRKELAPPQPQELFASFIDRIYEQVISQVRQLYRDTRI